MLDGLAVSAVLDSLSGRGLDDVIHPQDHFSGLRRRNEHLTLHGVRFGDTQSLHASDTTVLHIWNQTATPMSHKAQHLRSFSYLKRL